MPNNPFLKLGLFLVGCNGGGEAVHCKAVKLLVFYQQNSENSRKVEEYLHDLTRLHDLREQDIKIIDPYTRNGAADANLYDIMAYPGIVVTDSNGQYVHGWSGELPLMDELMSYAFSLQ